MRKQVTAYIAAMCLLAAGGFYAGSQWAQSADPGADDEPTWCDDGQRPTPWCGCEPPNYGTDC